MGGGCATSASTFAGDGTNRKKVYERVMVSIASIERSERRSGSRKKKTGMSTFSLGFSICGERDLFNGESRRYLI